ncbi:MAG: hypothetical protein C5B50_13935 [Verrucomicrobia bacterium]|nr:MAG: hypothetical protein C5B50_13935 [Verrucomicrobiota bacterium]
MQAKFFQEKLFNDRLADTSATWSAPAKRSDDGALALRKTPADAKAVQPDSAAVQERGIYAASTAVAMDGPGNPDVAVHSAREAA